MDWLEGQIGQLAHLVASARNYNDLNGLAEGVMVAESIQGMLEELRDRSLTSAP